AGAVDVNDVERRACGHAQSLALAHGEVVDAVMPAEHAPRGGDEFAGGVRELLALLVEIGIDEALVIAAGNKADLLRVGLFRQAEPVLPRQSAHLRLAHFAQREARAAELFLGEPEEEVGLILCSIRRATQQPAVALRRKLAACVVAGGQQVCANLPSRDQKLIKLQVVVAQSARDGRAPGKILGDKRTHHVALKPLLVIDNVVGNAQVLGHGARVVDILNGAAAPLDVLRHALATGEPALVPELHGQANHVVAFGAQHGRDGGGIDTARHGYGNGLGLWHLYPLYRAGRFTAESAENAENAEIWPQINADER